MAKKTIYGTNLDDKITFGTPTSDDGNSYDIYALDGDDEINLYVGGEQYVEAGYGNDRVTIAGSGYANVYGGFGNDFLYHADSFLDVNGVARLDGGQGDDTIISVVAGNDLLDGGSGNDKLTGAKGNTLYGGIGDDFFDLSKLSNEADAKVVEYANEGYDIVQANFSTYRFGANIEEYRAAFSTSTSIWGTDTANVVKLQAGNDTVRVYGGNDVVEAGSGNDIIYGGLGNDKLYGGVGRYGVDPANDGNDTIYGEDGDDIIDGGTGADYLSGGNGNDALYGGGFGDADTLVGGAGDDVYLLDGYDTVVEAAGGGIDTVIFDGEVLTLAANVENFVTWTANPFNQSYSPGNQFITGNALANKFDATGYGATFLGEGGADTMTISGFNNTVRGGDGDDRISGSGTLYGDAGNDRVNGSSGNDVLYGGTGNDELGGGMGADVINGDDGNDTIYGGGDDDIVSGGRGFDTLYGENGNDSIRGGDLNDMLHGNAGNDSLRGEMGSDFLWGDAGSDSFVYSSAAHSRVGDGIDQIRDFERGFDKIHLAGIDANSSLAGDQAFTWLGVEPRGMTNAAGNLWGDFIEATATTSSYIKVFGDVTGDGVAEFQIDVYGATTLSAVDFVL